MRIGYTRRADISTRRSQCRMSSLSSASFCNNASGALRATHCRGPRGSPLSTPCVPLAYPLSSTAVARGAGPAEVSGIPFETRPRCESEQQRAAPCLLMHLAQHEAVGRSALCVNWRRCYRPRLLAATRRRCRRRRRRARLQRRCYVGLGGRRGSVRRAGGREGAQQRRLSAAGRSEDVHVDALLPAHSPSV